MGNVGQGETSGDSSDDVDSSLSDQEIEILAYEKWVKRGKPKDSAWEDWFEARYELEQLRFEAQQSARSQNVDGTQFLQAILDNARAIIVVKDILGRYLVANREFENLCSGDPLSWTGRTDYDLFPAEFAAAFRVNDLLVFQANNSLEFEESLLSSDGTHTYRSIKFPLLNAAGAPYAICGIMTDISEQKRRQLQWELSCSVTETLANSASVAEACTKLLQIICETLRWSVGVLWVAEGNQPRLCCESIWHFPHLDLAEFVQQCSRFRFAQNEGLPGRVWASGAPVWITNVAADPTLTRYRLFQNDEMRAAVAFPIKDGRSVVGAMEFFSRRIQEPDHFIFALMANIGSQISQYIHRGQAERAVHQRDHEFKLAHEIQRGLLPSRPPAIHGFEIAGYSKPAQETGGDYFDYFPLPDGTWAIAIADASGHGIGAALLMAETRSFVRALALAEHDVEAILERTNHHFVRDTGGEHFVTFFLACLDPLSRSFLYASAGHPPGYLIDAQGNIKDILESTGIPIGLFDDVRYSRTEAKSIQSRDVIFLQTDGVAEALDPSGAMFGGKRVLEIVRNNVGLPAADIIYHIEAEVEQFTLANQLDDMTMVCIKAL